MESALAKNLRTTQGATITSATSRSTKLHAAAGIFTARLKTADYSLPFDRLSAKKTTKPLNGMNKQITNHGKIIM